MSRLLRRLAPRPATVIAYLALTISMSGVAYAAGTIGSGDVIDNSLQSVDLKDGAAVGSADVINDSLTGTDIKESSLKGVARKLLFDIAPDGVWHSLNTVGGYNFEAVCQHNVAFDGVELNLAATGPAGSADWMFNQASDQTSSDPEQNLQLRAGGKLLAASTRTNLLAIAEYLNGNYTRAQGTFFLRTGSTVIRLDFDARASTTSGERCGIFGTVTVAA